MGSGRPGPDPIKTRYGCCVPALTGLARKVELKNPVTKDRVLERHAA